MSLHAVALRALLDSGVKVGLLHGGALVASVEPREVRWLYDTPGLARADVQFTFDAEVEFDAGALVVDGEVERVMPFAGSIRLLAGMSYLYHVHLSITDRA